MASTGFILAAITAGIIPANKPTLTEIKTPRVKLNKEI